MSSLTSKLIRNAPGTEGGPAAEGGEPTNATSPTNATDAASVPGRDILDVHGCYVPSTDIHLARSCSMGSSNEIVAHS